MAETGKSLLQAAEEVRADAAAKLLRGDPNDSVQIARYMGAAEIIEEIHLAAASGLVVLGTINRETGDYIPPGLPPNEKLVDINLPENKSHGRRKYS